MKRRWVVKGSYTIEAALIMPIIYSVIVLIIYWSLFLHDRAVLSSAAYTAALRGSQLISGEDVFTQVESAAGELIENKLLATRNISTDIYMTGNEIMVNYTGDLIIPTGALLCRYLSGGRESIAVNAAGKAKCNDAIKFIRECRFIENAYNSLH